MRSRKDIRYLCLNQSSVIMVTKLGKINAVIVLIFLMVVSSCATSAIRENRSWNVALRERGVSLELAQWRKGALSEVHYDMWFKVPAEKGVDVKGRSIITFKYDSQSSSQNGHNPIALPVDFKADNSQLGEVKVNGEVVDTHIDNEHILIPIERIAQGANTIEIEFVAGNRSLNRRDDFLYTLSVPDRARTIYPCFDQPNLKATFALTVEVPQGWTAISNTNIAQEIAIEAVTATDDQSTAQVAGTTAQTSQINTSSAPTKQIQFAESEPLPTYLFSFVAGEFKKETLQLDSRGQSISLYHRENDPAKVAQCYDMLEQVFWSIRWLESFTNIPYPFAKYDCVLIPGFQFNGMEHTGATLYNDATMFLEANAGLSAQISRFSLIAHETAHMWFGDYVTMDWFNDVWTKEIFANYFAAEMVADRFPNTQVGSKLTDYIIKSFAEDRTLGSTPIRQDLDNLRNAGLIYSNIVYNKAPLVMNMLVEKMGEEPFKQGIREYLSTYAYSNATWNDLIAILDPLCEADLTSWSHVWVEENNMPTIETSFDNEAIYIKQYPYRDIPQGRVWEQKLTFKAICEGGDVYSFSCDMKEDALKIEAKDLPFDLTTLQYILPNPDATSYGYFALDNAHIEYFTKVIHTLHLLPEEKASLLITLNENYLKHRIDGAQYAQFLLNYLLEESNPLCFAQAIGYFNTAVFKNDLTERGDFKNFEDQLWNIFQANSQSESKRLVVLSLARNHRSEESFAKLYEIFKNPNSIKGFLLAENDRSSLCFELALRDVENCQNILAIERERITNPDRLARFDYIAQAIDPANMEGCFELLEDPHQREIEPWTLSMLGYLTHPLRADQAHNFIIPCLEMLPDIQTTGDIFFPARWAQVVLGAYKGDENRILVEDFLKTHSYFSKLLQKKILIAIPE